MNMLYSIVMSVGTADARLQKNKMGKSVVTTTD